MIESQLTTLEVSGLIRLAQLEPEQEYLFRHALIQDAAYESVLKADRRRLHEVVGRVLEELYADHLDEIALLLGQHFEQAGDEERALQYYSQAAENAARRFASPEAISQYSNAIRVAGQKPIPSLYRARGLAHGTLGHFELARADHEEALALAQTSADTQAEWRALLDLGLLWAQRDYAKAGHYYRLAQQAAQALGDGPTMAHTLNRLGNWYVNVEDPQAAQQYHQQALEIFEQLNDQHGLAETNDLLGMTYLLSCDLWRSHRHYEQAIALFYKLGDQQGASSSLAAQALGAATVQTSTMVPIITLAQAAQCSLDSLALARTTGWRAGEAFALFSLSQVALAAGDFEQAWQVVKEGIEIAEAIEHKQWLVSARLAQGLFARDTGDLDSALNFMERALTEARETGSLHWVRTATGMLANVYVLRGDFELARQVIDAVLDESSASLTLGHRLVWHALAELTLAQGRFAEALSLIDRLSASVPNRPEQGEHHILALAYLRAETYKKLGRTIEARNVAEAALPIAREQGAEPLAVHLYLLMSELYLAQGQTAEAQQEAQAARGLVEGMARKLNDPAARQRFSVYMLKPLEALNL